MIYLFRRVSKVLKGGFGIIALLSGVCIGLTEGTSALAQGSLVGLSTDGTLYEINKTDGVLTEIYHEDIASFSLGATARLKNAFYYVVAPSGSAEKAIYKAHLVTGAVSHVDLDRSSGDDEVRALFFNGKKLYGVFYNGNAGTAGVYRINPRTGATILLRDLSALDLDPLPGAITRLGRFYYLLAKPESDSTIRKLVRFTLGGGAPRVFDVQAAGSVPVRCDRLKVNIERLDFVCLASPSDTEVDVCRLSPKGRAKCFGALAGVERIGGGHTMVTPDGKKFYAFVYVPGDQNAQRLVRFNSRGAIKSLSTVSSIIIGARFGVEGEDVAESAP